MRLKSYMTFRQDGGVGYNIRSLLHFLFLPFFYARAYSENRNVENFLRLSWPSVFPLLLVTLHLAVAAFRTQFSYDVETVLFIWRCLMCSLFFTAPFWLLANKCSTKRNGFSTFSKTKSKRKLIFHFALMYHWIEPNLSQSAIKHTYA